jgi:hypothetical protein
VQAGACNRKVDVLQAGNMLPAVGIAQARRKVQEYDAYLENWNKWEDLIGYASHA